jgi:hypothetical protein
LGRGPEEVPAPGPNCRVSGVITVELVAGRETGEERSRTLLTSPVTMLAFLFLDVGRTEDECSGLPNASPAAAIPIVLDATSCAY